MSRDYHGFRGKEQKIVFLCYFINTKQIRMVTIFIITKNKESAKEIAMRILEERLAYSLNILDNVFSMRREKGKIVEYHETLILAKTKALLYHKVEELIKNLDADHQPLVFSFPITQMQQTLFDSIQASTLKV